MNTYLFSILDSVSKDHPALGFFCLETSVSSLNLNSGHTHLCSLLLALLVALIYWIKYLQMSNPGISRPQFYPQLGPLITMAFFFSF